MKLWSWALALSIASGSTAIAQSAPTNQELKIGISQEFESFNPAIYSMAATGHMITLAVRGLVYLNAEGQWKPQLVKTIPSLKNGLAKKVGDKLVVNWELLENAKWGDGQPVVCDDIKFSWEVRLNESVSVPSRDAAQNIEKIEWDAKTPKKCVITYKVQKWEFFRDTMDPMPRHIEGPVLAKYATQKEGYDQNSNYNKNPTNPGLYNGPYVVSELKLGSHVIFTANPHFYGKKPAIQKLVFKLIPNTGTLEANLRSGTIDMISTLGLAFDQALAFDKKVKAENLPYNVVFQPGTTYEHIDLNLDHPALSDLKVRKALVHAINRDELTKALFEGKQKAAIHNLAPLDPAFTADPKKVTIYPYSKREAVKLFEEAGWKPGADGIRVKDGKRLSLQFMTTAGNKTRETVQTLLQNQWKSVGAEIVIKNEPARVFFGETTKRRNYGAMAMYAWISTPESSPKTTLHSSNVVTEANQWTGQNYTGWKNAKVDSLIDQFESEFDPAKRKELIHGILKEYTNEVPVIPLYYRSDVGVIPKNLKGYKIPGHQYYETNDAEQWTLGSVLK